MRQLIQRISKHINDGILSDDFAVSDNEIQLYITDAIAFGLVGGVYNNAHVTGTMEVPEGYLVTYKLPEATADPVSGYWKTTLPQPPLSLPLGYSISRVYFDMGNGSISTDALPIKNRRVGYRNLLPMPIGVRYWVESTTMWLAASDNSQLSGSSIYVQMPSARSSDVDAPLNMPDDAVNAVFDMVVKKIVQRQQMPRDIVSDDLPAGNNNIKTQR